MVLVEGGLYSEQVSLMRPNDIEIRILVLKEMVLIVKGGLNFELSLYRKFTDIFSQFKYQ